MNSTASNPHETLPSVAHEKLCSVALRASMLMKIAKLSSSPSPISAHRRRSAAGKTLAQCFHDLGAQTESRSRQSQEGVLEVDKAGSRGIGQKTGRAGDSQTETHRDLAPSFFIKDQQAAIPVLPGQRNGGGLAGIQGPCFLQIRCLIRNDGNPIGQTQKQIPQTFRRTRVDGLTPDGRGDGHLAIKPTEQIQLADLGQAGQHGVVTHDDHGAARRNSKEAQASARISSPDWLGHTPCLDSTACASQRDSSSSILRICSSESTSFAYASAAKASRAARLRFWKPAPSSAAKSSGMFTVRVIAVKGIPTRHALQTRKSSPHPQEFTSPHTSFASTVADRRHKTPLHLFHSRKFAPIRG